MANQDASFGLRPVRTSISSQQQNRYRIASGYSTAIFKCDLVKLITTGGIERMAAGDGGFVLGVLMVVSIQIRQRISQLFQIATPVAFQHPTSWQMLLMIRALHSKFKLMTLFQ